MPGFIPDDYVPDTGQRLDFYRRLAQARDEDDVRATLAELADRYGPLPDEAQLLGEVMIDKTHRARAGRARLRARRRRASCCRSAATRASTRRKVTEAGAAKGSRWKLTPDMRLSYSLDDRESATASPRRAPACSR